MIAKRIVPLFSLACLCACAPGLRPGGSSGTGPGGGSFAEEDPVFDRSACGTAPLPVWSALTPPEIKALQGRDKAASGDAHALLALAILASGDVRTQTGYDSIQARFDGFTAKQRKELARARNDWERGRWLLVEMHEAFFRGGSKPADGRMQPGYDWNQSRLTGIFSSGMYNCISSSLLYAALAQEFGLKPQGVILTTHAFVQVTLGDGKRIDVETTSPSGFDWIHDETFYKRHATGFFASLGIKPSTFADYKARRIVSPLELVAYNMWNQHTGRDRMHPEDRHRLAEARAWIDADDADAQTNRIAIYSTERTYLSGRGDSAALERFFRTVMPPMPALRKRWDGDAGLANHIAWMSFYYADFLRGRGSDEAAMPWVDSSLAWLKPEAKEGPALKGNDMAEIAMIAQDLGNRKELARAETYLLGYPAAVRDDADIRAALTWVYQEMAGRAWERKDWEAAAKAFDKSLAFASKEYQKPLRGNLSGAYLNWSIGYQNEGDWPKAKAVLRQCLDKLPDESRCRSQMQELAARHGGDE